MNKRQKKKEFKRATGSNPPVWVSYKGEFYHIILEKPWGGLKEKRQQEARNLEAFNRVMAKRRKRRWNRS